MFIVVFLLLDVALAAVLVPVLVMVLTALIVIVVCALHWRNKYVCILIIMQRQKKNPPFENLSFVLHNCIHFSS